MDDLIEALEKIKQDVQCMHYAFPEERNVKL